MKRLAEEEKEKLRQELQKMSADRSATVKKELFVSKFLRILMIASAVLLGIILLSAIFFPTRHPPLKRYGQVEARTNLAAIRTCQESYKGGRYELNWAYPI